VGAVAAQKRPERPKVHAEFYFGSIPPSREAAKAMAQEKARLVMVGYHVGWSEEKIAKELKWQTREVDTIHSDLTELGLLGRRGTDTRPSVLVVRNQDLNELDSLLQRHIREFALILQTNLEEVESMLSSLSGEQEVPLERRLYATVVGGILFGGMIDVFADDKTFMPAPPARGKGGQFWGWLVESDPTLAGRTQREAWDSEAYQIVSIGSPLPEERPSLEEIRKSGWILAEPDARRFRTFALVMARDKLLPFFKSQREELLKAHRQVDSGRYSSFASFVAWYYTAVANGAVDRLAMSGRLVAPKEPTHYALKTPVR
jgi:hypothetical protein